MNISSPFLSGSPSLSLWCSDRIRHCLRLFVRVVDWCLSRLVRLICCQMLLITALGVWTMHFWIAVVCFQPASLLIGKVWVPVIHFCAFPYTAKCIGEWRVGRMIGPCRLISVPPLIGSTIRAFSVSSAVWVFEVLCCLYWHNFYQTDHSTLWWMVVG